jgi:hypothetical protein
LDWPDAVALVLGFLDFRCLLLAFMFCVTSLRHLKQLAAGANHHRFPSTVHAMILHTQHHTQKLPEVSPCEVGISWFAQCAMVNGLRLIKIIKSASPFMTRRQNSAHKATQRTYSALVFGSFLTKNPTADGGL